MQVKQIENGIECKRVRGHLKDDFTKQIEALEVGQSFLVVVSSVKESAYVRSRASLIASRNGFKASVSKESDSELRVHRTA